MREGTSNDEQSKMAGGLRPRISSRRRGRLLWRLQLRHGPCALGAKKAERAVAAEGSFICSVCPKEAGRLMLLGDAFAPQLSHDNPRYHDSVRGRCPSGHERMLED
jgi:hypothetical protein